MNNRQVAEAFASGATTGKGSNLFIDGNTIYSYGYHFAICTRVDGYYFFTERRYSMTTAKHKSYVLSALPAHRVLWSPDGLIPTIDACRTYRHNLAEQCAALKRHGTYKERRLSLALIQAGNTQSCVSELQTFGGIR